MVEVAITKMSSKGQIVIPHEIRNKIKEGEKLLIFSSDDSIILRKATKLDEQFKEDLEFARRTEEAWKQHDGKKFTEYSEEEFLKNLEKW